MNTIRQPVLQPPSDHPATICFGCEGCCVKVGSCVDGALSKNAYLVRHEVAADRHWVVCDEFLVHKKRASLNSSVLTALLCAPSELSVVNLPLVFASPVHTEGLWIDYGTWVERRVVILDRLNDGFEV